MARTALIVGATGLIGESCLHLLLGQAEYERVIAVVRRTAGVRHPKLQERVTDFEKLSGSTFGGAHDVFCALGTTIKRAGSQAAFRRVDCDYVKAVAEACIAEGATRFIVVSSVGADPGSKNFYLRTKGEMEQVVSALPFEAVHIMRPSLLLGTRKERRFGERLAQILVPSLNWLFWGGMKRYRAISAATVAQAMTQAALHGEPGVHVHDYPEIVALAR